MTGLLNKLIKPGEQCFTGVMLRGKEGYGIGIVTAGEKGFTPSQYPDIDTYLEAQDIAEKMNDNIGIPKKKAFEMVARSMRAENIPYFDDE
jgi:hypothetical protein